MIDAAIRFAVVSLLIGVALVCGLGLYRGAWRQQVDDDVREMRWAGIFVFTAGLAPNQGYWWLWHMSAIAGRPDVKASLEAHATLVVVPCLLVMMLGLSMILVGFSKTRFGVAWPVASAGVIGVLVMIGLITASAVRL